MLGIELILCIYVDLELRLPRLETSVALDG